MSQPPQALKDESPFAILTGIVAIAAAILSPILAGWQGLALSLAIISLSAWAFLFWRVRPKSSRRQRLRELGLVGLALVVVGLLFVLTDWKSITAGEDSGVRAAANEVYAELQNDAYVVSHESGEDAWLDVESNTGSFPSNSHTLAGALDANDFQRLEDFFNWAACGIQCGIGNDASRNFQDLRVTLRSALNVLAPYVQ